MIHIVGEQSSLDIRVNLKFNCYNATKTAIEGPSHSETPPKVDK